MTTPAYASNALPQANDSPVSPSITRACEYCCEPFQPRRKWARFCGTPCRNEANARKASTGIRGVVSSVRVMRRGSISVTLRFGLDERDRALKIEPGTVVAVEVT